MTADDEYYDLPYRRDSSNRTNTVLMYCHLCRDQLTRSHHEARDVMLSLDARLAHEAGSRGYEAKHDPAQLESTLLHK